MSDRYILDGHEVVPATLEEWATWYETGDRVVKQTATKDSRISTVFLGLDHSFGIGPIQVFETMIFGGPHDQACWRYETWEQAEAGHTSAVEKAEASE